MKIFILLLLIQAHAAGTLTGEFVKARDPFRAPQIKKVLQGVKAELEQFSVDAFKMTGVVTGPDHMRGMVMSPDGKTYFVSERMKIGNRSGEIKRITTESIVVREKIVNILGENEYFDTEIKLNADALLQTPKQPGVPGQ